MPSTERPRHKVALAPNVRPDSNVSRTTGIVVMMNTMLIARLSGSRSMASDLDLEAQFHDAVRRQVEE